MFSGHEDLHPELFPEKVAQWIASINVDSVPKAMWPEVFGPNNPSPDARQICSRRWRPQASK